MGLYYWNILSICPAKFKNDIFFFSCKIMCLPHCYYTPGEYFFLYFVFIILMQDISHDQEPWWHTMDQSGRPGSCHSHWRMRAMCVLSELSRSAVLSGSPCVVPFCFFVFFSSWTIQCPGLSAALLSLAHRFRICTSSVLYVCMLPKKEACRPQTHMYILTHTKNLIGLVKKKSMYTDVVSLTYRHAQMQQF